MTTSLTASKFLPTKLTQSTARELFSTIDNLLLDCDGVLWKGSQKIPGAADTVRHLEERSGKKIYYVTNNSSRNRTQTMEKLHSMMYKCTPDQILCTSQVGAWYLKKHHPDIRKVYLVGNPAMKHELDSVGIQSFGLGPDVVDPNSMASHWPKFVQTKLEKEVDCVFIGFDPHISYIKMIKAASYIERPGCLFVATNNDARLPVTEDIVIPGTGSVLAGIIHATRQPDRWIGKPGSTMIEMLKEEHGLDPHKSLMVGDSLATDIAFANRNNMKSLFVLTGYDSLESCNKPSGTGAAAAGASSSSGPCAPNELRPDFYIDSFGDVLPFLNDIES